MVNNRWLADRAVERNCRRKSKGEPGSMVVDLAEEQLRRWLLVANVRIGTYLGIWVYVLGVLAESRIECMYSRESFDAAGLSLL